MSVEITMPQAEAPPPAPVDQDIDKCRHDQAHDGSQDRHHRAAPVGEFAQHEFALHLQADDEEEERHQAIVAPVMQAQRQLGAAQSHGELGVPERGVGVAHRRVGPDQGHDSAKEQQPGGNQVRARMPAQPSQKVLDVARVTGRLVHLEHNGCVCDLPSRGTRVMCGLGTDWPSS